MKKSIIISLVGGFILGKAGDTVFGSKKAREIYTQLTTGAFIAKDAVMEYVEKVQAGASDIAEDAKHRVEKYYLEKEAAFEQERGADPVPVVSEETAEA